MTRIARKVAFDFQSYNPGHLIFRIMKKIEYLNIRNLEYDKNELSRTLKKYTSKKK